MSMFGRHDRTPSAGGRSTRFGFGGRLIRKLRALAGRPRSRSEEFGVEPLEQRQLMFALTVTNVDPATGLGTATAQFGYVIPYLFKQ